MTNTQITEQTAISLKITIPLLILAVSIAGTWAIMTEKIDAVENEVADVSPSLERVTRSTVRLDMATKILETTVSDLKENQRDAKAREAELKEALYEMKTGQMVIIEKLNMIEAKNGGS